MPYNVQCALCISCSNATQPVPERPTAIKCNAGHRPAKTAVRSFPPVFDGEQCVNKVHACHDYVDMVRPYRVWHGEYTQMPSAYQMSLPSALVRIIDDEDEGDDVIIIEDEQSDERVPADWDEFEDMTQRLIDMHE